MLLLIKTLSNLQIEIIQRLELDLTDWLINLIIELMYLYLITVNYALVE
ncbi:hypothetical protein GMJAKD_06265 [Candidatus Electrothrix aarhusensis]